jgi:hypothetical protein
MDEDGMKLWLDKSVVETSWWPSEKATLSI